MVALFSPHAFYFFYLQIFAGETWRGKICPEVRSWWGPFVRPTFLFFISCSLRCVTVVHGVLSVLFTQSPFLLPTIAFSCSRRGRCPHAGDCSCVPASVGCGVHPVSLRSASFPQALFLEARPQLCFL
eukprot:RCo042588